MIGVSHDPIACEKRARAYSEALEGSRNAKGAAGMCGGVAAHLTDVPAAGLVSSKTNGICDSFLKTGSKVFKSENTISFAPNVVALRRLKRLKKSVWASGHLHALADKGSRPPQCWFVTLTYRGVNDWAANHISYALRLYRMWCKRKGIACRYTWVAELQSRGAVHYHLLCWLPQGVRMPQWDRTYGGKNCFWPHGMTNTQKALAGVGYLMKYLSKLGELTVFPKGLRLYGIGGLDAQARGVRAWLNLPEWVKRSYGVGEVLRRKTGFLVKASGEFLEAAYVVQKSVGAMVITLLRPLPDRFHAGAYSSFPRVVA